MPILSCFYYYGSIVELEVRYVDAFGGSFLVHDCFGCIVFSVVPCEVECCFFKVCEEMCWDFDGDCIESADCF